MNNSFNPFSFHGRLGRGRFIGYFLAMNLIATVVFFVGTIAFTVLGDIYISEREAATLYTVFLTFSGLLYLSYGARRFHDLDVTGKWAIALVVPWGFILPAWIMWVGTGIIFIYLVFASGTDGPNRYGEGR